MRTGALLPIAFGLMLVVGLVLLVAVRERRQHAAGARLGSSEGNRHPPRDRREPPPSDRASC